MTAILLLPVQDTFYLWRRGRHALELPLSYCLQLTKYSLRGEGINRTELASNALLLTKFDTRRYEATIFVSKQAVAGVADVMHADPRWKVKRWSRIVS